VTSWSVLLLGIGLGLRHATDADHVVVVSALVQREPGIGRATRVAALWGLGHTATFLGLGLLVVLFGVRIPVAFERFVDLAVGVMLVGFGVRHLARTRAMVPVIANATTAGSGSDVRPLVIGCVHGLAGSAAIALLAATTIAAPTLAATYLVLFGLGTILGMVALTAVIARPIGWAMQRGGGVQRVATVLAALLSMLLGATILVEHLR